MASAAYPPRRQSSGKRFVTTTESGLSYVASKLHEMDSREEIAKDLRDRKLRNTKTNICFGYNKVNYESDAMARQKECSNVHVDQPTPQELRQLKLGLTKTSFSLGHDPITYKKTSTLPYPVGDMKNYQGQLNTEVKNMIKKSSIYFGSDNVKMKPHSHLSFVNMSKAGSNEEFSKRKQEIADLTKQLRAHNFSFGHNNDEKTTNYRRNFNRTYDIEDTTEQKKIQKEIVKDLRACHFELGHDKTHWETDYQRQIRGVGKGRTMVEIQQELDNAKAMKKGLQRTNFVLGNEDDYM